MSDFYIYKDPADCEDCEDSCEGKHCLITENILGTILGEE